MYKKEINDRIMYYEYVGMSENIRDFYDRYETRDPSIIPKGSDEILDNIIKDAIAFREKHSDCLSGKYALELLERSVTLLEDYTGIFYRNKTQEIFMYGFGVKGIHYFKPLN